MVQADGMDSQSYYHIARSHLEESEREGKVKLLVGYLGSFLVKV